MTSHDSICRILVTETSPHAARRVMTFLQAEGLRGVRLVLTDLQPPSGFKPAADITFAEADLCETAALRCTCKFGKVTTASRWQRDVGKILEERIQA